MSTVKEFLSTLEDLDAKKVDVLVDPKEDFRFKDGQLLLAKDAFSKFNMSKLADNQLATRLDIPTKYFNHLRNIGELDLLDENVNTMKNRIDKKLFIRTYQNGHKDARAILSDRYRTIDNKDVYLCCLDELSSRNVDVANLNLDDNFMTVQFKSEDLVRQVRPGDDVVAGISIRNLEVGMGSVQVVPRIFRLVCSNGWIVEQFQTRKVHLGAGDGGEFESSMVYNDIRSSIRNIFDSFGAIVARIKDSTDHQFDISKIRTVIKNIVNEYQMTEDQKDRLLIHWGAEPEASLYGVSNAITRMAQDEPDFQNKYRLEQIGGRFISEEPKKLFQKFVIAA